MLTRYAYLVAGVLLLALAGVPARAQVAATVNCAAPAGTPTGHIDWPAANPVWRLDFLRPARSTGSDGSGIELRDVYYNGNLVFKRAHAPVLNVRYDSACSCFRDWQDQETRFQADGVRPGQTCFAESTPGFVRSNCEVNQESGGTQGGDIGSFTGVSVEDFGTELVLTSNMSAGWYRYRMKWHLYADGRIWPEYSFGNQGTSCTAGSRRHHVYWRFDFDVDGTPTNDVVREINPTTSATTTFTTEAQRTWGTASDGVYWTVADAASGRGYSVEPSTADRLLAVDAFSKFDAAVLRYSATQIDDGSPSCEISPTGIGLNSESVANQDVVFWYRSGSFKQGGSQYECDIVGPMLRPLDIVPVELTTFDATLDAGRTALLRWNTASETNNAGFSVEHRLAEEGSWQTLGFVEGQGTTAEAQAYTYATGALPGGVHVFRLKQVDFDGAFEYSQEVELAVDVPGSFVLQSAYPNPFNPTTTVRFKVGQAQQVRIEVIDALGRIVQTPFSGYAEANTFESVRIDGSALPSGTYTVRLVGDAVQGTTRIVLIK